MTSKNYTSFAILIFSFTLLYKVDPLPGQVFEWKSITSVGVIRDIDVANGSVWAGSNGGVLQLEIGSEEVVRFTNTEGLSANEVVAVQIDQSGAIWFALFDGTLNRYLPDEDAWAVFEDYKDQIISDLVAFGDSLYVALDIGVSLFTLDKLEVKETYVNLGLSSGGNLEKIAAKSVFIGGSDIWVSTDKGAAKSSLTFSNLQAPANWTQHTVANGLPTNEINEIVVLNSVPYAATNSGASRLVDGNWEAIGLNNTPVLALEVVVAGQFFPETTVVSFTREGVFWFTPQGSWSRLGPRLTDVSALTADDEGRLWIGRADRGLATYSESTNEWNLFEINSPASNNFKSLALDSKGRLWCASQFGGVHMLEGQTWTNFNTSNGLKSIDQRAVVVDNEDRIWFGSWGGGITIIEDTATGFTFTRVDTGGGLLAGADTPAFVVINHLELDQIGNIWVLNREANNTRALIAHTPDDNWVHFSTSEGLQTTLVQALEIDRSGRVWIGTDARGVRVLDYGAAIMDKSDDDFTQDLVVNPDNLASNNVRALAEDRDGVMWIGTDEGANFWFANRVGRQFGLISDFVNVIGIDARNNKWFGTANGVSVLADDGVSWTHFTTGNSPLVSATVQSFVFNNETGEVWIGTTNGLSRVQTPFTAPQPNLTLLTGYPNPFIIDGPTQIFTITNLAENSSVVVYNASGAKIRSFDANEIQGAQAFWDGRDEDNNVVPSGVYVYLAFTSGGISATGKVAVIRR